MKRLRLLATVAAAAVLVVTLLYASRAALADRQHRSAPVRRDTFLDELSSLHATHARRLDGLFNNRPAIDAANREHRIEVEALYHKHGREMPAAMRPGGD